MGIGQLLIWIFSATSSCHHAPGDIGTRAFLAPSPTPQPHQGANVVTCPLFRLDSGSSTQAVQGQEPVAKTSLVFGEDDFSAQPPIQGNNGGLMAVLQVCHVEQGFGIVLPRLWGFLGESDGKTIMVSSSQPRRLLPPGATATGQRKAERRTQRWQIPEEKTAIAESKTRGGCRGSHCQDRENPCADARGSDAGAAPQAAQAEELAGPERDSRELCHRTLGGTAGTTTIDGSIGTSPGPSRLSEGGDGSDRPDYGQVGCQDPPSSGRPTARDVPGTGTSQSCTSLLRSWMGHLCGRTPGNAAEAVCGQGGKPVADGLRLRDVVQQVGRGQSCTESSLQPRGRGSHRDRGLRCRGGDGGRSGQVCARDGLDDSATRADIPATPNAVRRSGEGQGHGHRRCCTTGWVSHAKEAEQDHRGAGRQGRTAEQKRWKGCSQKQGRIWQALAVFLSGPPTGLLRLGGPTPQPECVVSHSIQLERDFVDADMACMIGVQLAYDVHCLSHKPERRLDPRIEYEPCMIFNSKDPTDMPANILEDYDIPCTCSSSPRLDDAASAFRSTRRNMVQSGSGSDEAGAQHLRVLTGTLQSELRSSLKPTVYRTSRASLYRVTFSDHVQEKPPWRHQPFSLLRVVRGALEARSQRLQPVASNATVPRQASVYTATRENCSEQAHVDALSQQSRLLACTAQVPHIALSRATQRPRDPSDRTPMPVKWPSTIAYMRAERVTYVPDHIDHTMLTWPLPSLPIVWQSTQDETGARQFTVLEAGGRPRLRACSDEWTLHDMVTDAIASARQSVRSVQIIERPLTGLPRPQLVLTHASADQQALAVPLDFRRSHGWIITSHILPVATLDEMPALGPPGVPRPAELDFQQRPLVALLDSAGHRHEIVSAPLHRYEWFTPVFEVLATGPASLPLVALTSSTTTSTTTTPIDHGLFRRPVLLPGVLEQAELLPKGILTAPGAHLPIAELGLFQLVTRGSAGCTPFLFMVRGCEPVRLDGSRSWTLLDFCAAAASNAECAPRRVQVLTSSIPELLQPQIVVTDRSDDPDLTLVPVDMRAAPGGVVVPVLLRHGMSASEVVDAIIAEIPDSSAFFADATVGVDFFFQDAAGFVWQQLPCHLQAIQWLVLRRGAAPFVRSSQVAASTTTTTAGQTWEVVRGSAVDGPPELRAVDSAFALSPPLLQERIYGQLGKCAAEIPASIASCHARPTLVEVSASSQAPHWRDPVSIPPEGPPPDPDRDPRTPPVTARGPSSSRPSNVDMLRAAQVRVTPPEVAQAAVYTAPVGAFSWSSAPNGPHTGAFSVFDARRHHIVDRAYAQASLQEVVALAIAHAPFQVAAVQILTHTVQGLPQPQLVLTEAGRAPQESPLVWDLRSIQEPVLTIRHLARELRDEALQKLQLLLLRDLRAEMSRGTLALFDCLGALPVQFPSDLSAMQHIRATALTGPSAPASSHTGPARPTGVPEVVGRGNRPRIGPVRQHPPGLRLTVMRGSHRFFVDCTFDNGAIDTLVFDLLVQHHNQASLPSSFQLVLSGAQPLRMGYYQEVVFVVQEGSQTATVWDGRHLGQELQVNLHPPTQSTCQVLDADWTNNGWRLFVNGIPEAAAMRHIRTGDYLQPCSGAQCPGVVPLGGVLAICPMLRPYAWPLEVTLSGSGFSASLRKRRKQLGSHRMPEGTARVYGPHHGEIFIQVGTGMTPTALQVDTALQHLDGFPEGLNVLGTPTRHPHDADFVTRYRYRQDSTVLTPAPGHAGHFLVLLVHADTEVLPGVPANPRIMLYPQRGLRHGDVLQQFPEPHFVFGEESEEEHVTSDPAGPPPPEPMSVEQEEPISVVESGDEHASAVIDPSPTDGPRLAGSSDAIEPFSEGSDGTSLACTSSQRAPRRQIIFDQPAQSNLMSTRRPPGDGYVQQRAHGRVSGIPTPSGLRFLPSQNPFPLAMKPAAQALDDSGPPADDHMTKSLVLRFCAWTNSCQTSHKEKGLADFSSESTATCFLSFSPSSI